MKLKNVSIATALLLALTGCGSGGGGGGGNSNPNANTTLNNDQTTQSQVEKQKAELKTLKSQLSQAQINQKQAEEKLKSAEKTHHQNLTNAKNNLATAQDNLAKTQLALTQAQEKLAAAQKKQSQADQPKAELQSLKEQLSQAQEAQKQAEEKLKLAEKTHHQNLTTAKNNLATAQDNLTKTQLALTQAEEKLAVAQKNNENYVALQEQLTEATQKLSIAQQEKLQAEKNLNDKLAEENKLMSHAEVLDFALHNGLNKVDSEEFADDFQNRSKSFVIDQLIYVHKIIAFKNLARRYGLPEEEVRAFTRENKNKTLEEAANLLESKREEIEQKRAALLNELLTIAKEKGLDDWEANNFVHGREHQSKEQALQQLNKYLIEKAERETKLNELIELAKEKGLEDWEAQNFANQNIDSDKSNALETLNQLAVEKEKQRAEQEKERLQAQKEEQIRELAEQYKNAYFSNAHSFNSWDFAQQNKDKSLEEVTTELEQYKTNREKITELAKILTELNVYSYDVEQFIDENTFVSLDEAKANLDKKVDEAIINLKGTGDKPLGFLANQNHSIRNEPIIENDREVDNKTVTTYADIYNQKYSVITGNYNKTVEPYTETEYYYEEGDDRNIAPFRSREISKTRTIETYTVDDGSYPGSTNGFKTAVDKFPSEGRATYTGVAFDAKKQGELSYTVDFAERKGSGKITGLDHIGDITLQEAEIYKSASHNSMRVKGNAIAEAWVSQGGVTGEYAANFFGPNAEEIAGKTSLSRDMYQGMSKHSYTDPATGYSYEHSSPDRYIKDVTTVRDNNDTYKTSFAPQGDIDIGFGGTRGEIQK